MITKQTSFSTTDGQLFASVEAAQLHELEAFLKDAKFPEGTDFPNLAYTLVNNKDRIVDLLTMKATSHPKARKANGATRKRRTTPSTQPTAAA